MSPAAVAVVIAAVVAHRPTAELAAFTSEPGKFKVLMAGKPDVRETRTEAGKSPAVTASSLASDNVYLEVRSSGRPPTDTRTAEDVLEVIESAYGEVKGFKFVSSRPVATADKKHAGRQVRITDGKITLLVRAFVLPDRYYQVTATCSAAGLNDPAVARFHDSFEILP